MSHAASDALKTWPSCAAAVEMDELPVLNGATARVDALVVDVAPAPMNPVTTTPIFCPTSVACRVYVGELLGAPSEVVQPGLHWNHW